MVYRLYYRAVNDVGASDPTDTTSVALASPPAKANPPSKVAALSTSEKIVLLWTPPATTASPGGDITGYRLEMDDGLGGNFTIIYDSTSTPSLTQVVVGGASGLVSAVSGRGYRFRLAGRAFNGLGPASDVVTIHACAPPSQPGVPLLQSVTTTAATLNWTEPASNGACPILGYSLFVDDGADRKSVV